MRRSRRIRALAAVAYSVVLALALVPSFAPAASAQAIGTALRNARSAVSATPLQSGVKGTTPETDLMQGRQRATSFLPWLPAEKVPVPLHENAANGSWPRTDMMTTELNMYVWEFGPAKAADAYSTYRELWDDDAKALYGAFSSSGGVMPELKVEDATVAGRPAFRTTIRVGGSPLATHGIGWRQGPFIGYVSSGSDNLGRLPKVAEALSAELEKVGGVDEKPPADTAGGTAGEQPPAEIDAEIHMESNPSTGKPYVGVTADGRSTLKVEIAFGSKTDGRLTVTRPSLGKLQGEGTTTRIRGASRVIMVYTPPDYVPADALTEKLSSLADGTAWTAVVPLEFTFTETATDRARKLAADLRVVRAPVMMVHGFTGGLTTWANLAARLRERKWDPHLDLYYEGDQGIHAQAEALGRNISKRLADYRGAGIKVKRVDLVGHSMGGLISRTWVRGPFPESRFTGDVRKIIMVGTPNHGSSFLDKSIGNVISEFAQQHQIASQQLYARSAFMQALNRGEDAGRHLEPSVQYGCIYVLPDDWVVAAASSRLNGVASKVHKGLAHSGAIPWAPSITEAPVVWDEIEAWLSADIPRVPLRSVSAAIDRCEGDVTVISYGTGTPASSKVTATPRTVESFDDVETGPKSKARIRLLLGSGVWGTIDMDSDTRITLGHLAPQQVTVRVAKGSARFVSLKLTEAGHFVAVLGKEGPKWYEIAPDAKVIGLDTEFVVRAGASPSANVVEGRVIVQSPGTEGEGATVGPGNAVSLDASGTGAATVGEKWWEDGFYSVGPGEQLVRAWGSFAESLGALWDALLQRLGLWRPAAGIPFDALEGSRVVTEPVGTPPPDDTADAVDVSTGAGADTESADERTARDLVGIFLDSIREGRLDDARAMAADEYFAQGPANVVDTNGEFLSFEITGVTVQQDGSVAVAVSETWAWGVERFEYFVRPPDPGVEGSTYKITGWRRP